MVKKLLILLLLLVGCTPTTKETKMEDTTIKILCYGDSNTWGFDPEGFRYPKKDIWTSQLNEKLGSKYTVINEGLNGRTTALDVFGDSSYNGMNDLPGVLETHKDVDAIVFMLGTNDCSVVANAQDIQKGMESLIQYTLDYYDNDPKIVLVVPAAMQWNHYPAQLSRQLAPLYLELAQKYDCLYIDGTDLFEVSSIDGLHLSKKGHQQVAQTLYDFFKQNPIKS